VEGEVIVVTIFALALIPVTFLRFARPLPNKGAIDVDVVQNGEAEIVGTSHGRTTIPPSGGILAFVEDDCQTVGRQSGYVAKWSAKGDGSVVAHTVLTGSH
jgi:hypothetical protein